MRDFYGRALKKLDKLTLEQSQELLVSAVREINRMQMVFDSHHAGVLVCDEKHKLVIVNRCAYRFIPIDYAWGKKIWNAVKDERLIEIIKESLLKDGIVMNRELYLENHGYNRLLSVTILPLIGERRITGSIIYMEDITKMRKEEVRMRRVENLASLTTLAAGVAHEIKNPLGSISIHLQLLQKMLAKSGNSDETTNKYLNVLNEEVERLNNIVVDFLFAVRPMILELRDGNINKLIGQVIEFVNFEMKEANIRCILELDEKLPDVLIDERYMKQVFLNLAKNAQAAMEGSQDKLGSQDKPSAQDKPGGGELIITTKSTDNEVHIYVRDTGSGISEENIGKIFEPYFTTKKTGTGLGLTLVFKIIREHQGEIFVNSSPGKGTEFEIILPVYQKEKRMIAYNAVPAASAAPSACAARAFGGA